MRAALVAVATLWTGPALAASACFQLAEAPRLWRASLASDEVRISFVGHASFRIDTPEGVSAVTDFFGPWGAGAPPTVVTMNKAHSTHWTANPDPRIEHVLPGWDDSDPFGADHWLEVGDMVVRNVPTDIRRWGGTEENANSIFVFEVNGLCIGHLGHLHHVPTDAHFGRIGRLDVVMAPVDGGYTMNLPAMIETLQRFRAQVVLPMHWFGEANLQRFLAGMAEDFAIVDAGEEIVLSRDTLPSRPTVMVVR